MAQKKLIILISSFEINKTASEVMLPPFVFALTAAAMSAEVIIFFAGKSVELLELGKATKIDVSSYRQNGSDDETINSPRSLYDFICDNARLGVKIYACSMAVSTYLSANHQLIPEVTDIAGATFFIDKTLSPNWQVINF